MAGKKDIVEQALKLVFSGSKAVDEAGVPVRYYHGTTHDLPVVKPGTYFTEDPSEGSAYTFWTDLKNAEKHKGKYSIISAPELAGKRLEYFGTISDIDSPKVGEFYATDNGIMRYKGKGTWDVASDLGVDNGSLDMSDYTIGVKPHDNSEAAKQMVGEYEEAVKRAYPGGSGGNVIPAYLNVKNPKEMSPLEGNRFGERLGADPKWVADEIEKLKAQGYDSIVTTSDDPFYAVERKKPPKHYMIFEPTQAKSAIGNTGEYDFTNPDITKAYGGSIREGYQTKGRVVGDIVDQALKLVMGEGDDAAKAGIKAYRGTPQPTENLIDLFHGTTPEAFDAITSSGDIFGSSRFSPRRDVAETFAHNVGGDANTVVKVKAPASSLMIDLDLPAAKLLTPDEAAAYLDKPDWTILDFIENGYSVGVPDTSVLSIDRAAGGRIAKGPGGWVDDVVKMAGKAVMGEGDNVTRLSDVRSARETDALIKKIKSAVNLVKSGHFQAGRQALINQKSLDLHKSGMLPLQQGTIVTPPSTWDMPGDWRVSGYWYDEKDPRRFGYKLQNESGQTYDAAASDPRAGLRRDNPYSFGAGFKAYAGPNASPPKPVAPPVEKPATPKPPEVLDAINKEYEDLFGSEDPFKPRAHGGRIAKGPGGWLDDVVKMAGKVISGEGEDAAKAGIRAYHSSPHDFDKFEWSPRTSMTGEGAQAYGAGLYFAENPSVSGRGGDYWRQFFNKMPSGPERSATGSMFVNKFDRDLAAAQTERNLKYNEDQAIPGRYANGPDIEEGYRLLADQERQALDMLRSGQIVGPRTYEVNIDADPNQFLDWDKPLSEQSEAVKNAFRSMDIADESVWPNITANDAYEMLRVDSMGDDAFLRDQAYRLARRAEAGAGASRMLREAGIPGIKYLDAGSRGKGVAQVQVMYKGKPHGDPIPVQAWNQIDQLTNDYKAKGYDVEVQDLGTRNYVVFDDKLVSIIRKYGIAGASAMLGYNLMEQLDPKQALAASMADQDYKSSRPQRSMGGNNSISGALNVARRLNGVE